MSTPIDIPKTVLDTAYETLVAKQRKLADTRAKVKSALKRAEELGKEEFNLANDVRELRTFLTTANPTKYRLLADSTIYNEQ